VPDRPPLRERLLAAATDQIRERGVRAFSLRSTARAAGVDPAMVYREFADREALVEAVAVAAFVRLAEQVHTASAGLRDPAARLRAIGRAYVAFALAHPAEFEIMFAGGRRGDLPTELPSAYTALESVLDDLAAAGRLPPGASRDDAALVCWTSVHGVAWLLVDRALAGYPRSDPGDVVEVVLDHLVRSLILRPPGG
jgi:AcrR family transcriptional regulator